MPRCCLLLALAVSATPIAAGAQQATQVLPLQRVRLYEAGVAYFERSGMLGGSATLPVPRSHLDDALKTLVILHRDGGAKVAGVEMDQPVSDARGRALAGLEAVDTPSFASYLESLVGSDVDVVLEAARVRGRLLSFVPPENSGISRCMPGVEPETTPSTPAPCAPQALSSIVLITTRGELHHIASSDVKSIAPLDSRTAERLRVSTRSKHGTSTAEHALTVRLESGSDVTLGYVAEAPLWRASYRLVVEGSEAALQGWALIHNDTDEAWRGVRLELVNGQPDSFLFPLAAPRYASRRLVTPEQHLPSVPQLMNLTADDAWDGADLGYGTGQGFGAGGYGLGGGGRGTTYHSVVSEQESSLLGIGNLAEFDVAEGKFVGALFRYALSKNVDLGPRKSLLVPFLREKVGAERIAWFETPTAPAKSSIVFVNESAQTLPAGTIALFEGGGFAGESALERLEPGAQRLVHFGLDLDVALDLDDERKSEELRLLAFAGSVLVQHYVRRSVTDHVVTNRGAAPRRVQLRLEVVNNSRVTGADAIFYDRDRHGVDAVFQVPERQTKSYTLSIDEGLERRTPLTKLRTEDLRRFADTATLPAEQRDVVRRALPHLERHEALLRQRRILKHRVARLDERIARLARTLEIVRRADSGAGERQAALVVRLEAERSMHTARLDRIAPHAPLDRAKAELRKLGGG